MALEATERQLVVLLTAFKVSDCFDEKTATVIKTKKQHQTIDIKIGLLVESPTMHHNLLSALAMFLNSDPSFRARAPTAEDRKCITSLNCHHCSIEQWGQRRRVSVYSLLSKQYFQLFHS